MERTVTRHGVIDRRPVSLGGIPVDARKTDLGPDTQSRLAVAGGPAATEVDALFANRLIGELSLLY